MNLKLAIQKSGRLHEDSIKLLNDCGIAVKSSGHHLRTVAENFPMEVYFLRDDDIPQYVEDGVAHIGIVGENVLHEKGKEVEVIEALGFGKCRLSIAVKKNGFLQLVWFFKWKENSHELPGANTKVFKRKWHQCRNT